MGISRRLDHLIVATQNATLSLATLELRGYPEAWPIGPFWPGALTAGSALGPCNLEWVQKTGGATIHQIGALVFEPTGLKAAEEALSALTTVRRTEKIEPDPNLLMLRGFSESDCDTPQPICTNLFPDDPPFPFFFCAYSPAMRRRLSPAAFAVCSPLSRMVYGLGNYSESIRWIGELGLDDPLIEFVEAEKDGPIRLLASDGSDIPF